MHTYTLILIYIKSTQKAFSFILNIYIPAGLFLLGSIFTSVPGFFTSLWVTISADRGGGPLKNDDNGSCAMYYTINERISFRILNEWRRY